MNRQFPYPFRYTERHLSRVFYRDIPWQERARRCAQQCYPFWVIQEHQRLAGTVGNTDPHILIPPRIGVPEGIVMRDDNVQFLYHNGDVEYQPAYLTMSRFGIMDFTPYQRRQSGKDVLIAFQRNFTERDLWHITEFFEAGNGLMGFRCERV